MVLFVQSSDQHATTLHLHFNSELAVLELFGALGMLPKPSCGALQRAGFRGGRAVGASGLHGAPSLRSLRVCSIRLCPGAGLSTVRRLQHAVDTLPAATRADAAAPASTAKRRARAHGRLQDVRGVR